MTYPTIMPALTLDFKNSQQLDSRVTFSRTQTTGQATYINSAGNVAKANSDEARFEFDSNGNCLGLLFEESRTNLIANSQVFATGYSGAQFTITDNAVVAPDGTTTAASLLETAVNDAHYVQLSSSSQTDLSQSIFVKPNGRDNICVRFVTTGGDWYTITFNLTGNGSITQEIPGTGSNWTINSKSIAQLSNGWYRISVGATTSAATTYIFSVLGCDSSTPTLVSSYGFPQYVGDITKGYYVWGAQVEANSLPTSYIPTSGSTVTRAIDIAQLSTANVYGNEFTIINKPFGVSSGGPTLYLQGYPYIQRAVVYDGYLSQEQINTVTKKEDDNFWRWRVLGSSWEIKPTMSGTVTVDWGDGTSETLSNNTIVNHTFTNGGGYHEVGFRLDSGDWFSVNLNYTGAAEREKVVAVGPMPVGMATIGYLSYNFASNINAWDAYLVHTYGGANSHVINRTYRGLTSLKSFPFTVLDPGITSLNQAFMQCTSLESFPLIDTSSITNFKNAWQNCGNLTSFPAINTSSGENFQGAWSNCTNLTSFPAINTSSGTNFKNAWLNCSGLTSFPLINTSSATNLSSAWNGCSNITGAFPAIDTSSATDVSRAWSDCSGLTSFPLIDTTNCTGTFTDTWINCTGLTSFPAIVCNGSNYNEAWKGCTSLTTFPPNMFDAGTVTPGFGFNAAWTNCALTVQSIENILVSLDVSGVLNCSLGINGGTNAGQSTWTTAATTAYNNLVTKGWVISANP